VKPPFEFKVMRVRECAAANCLIDTPQSSYEYWTSNIPQAGWFDPAKEAFVVLVLNTRRRIIGHNLVALGSLDSIAVHAREVFRPIIVAAGSAAIMMHNLCAEEHKLCYVKRRLMCSHAPTALLSRWFRERKERYAAY